MKMKVFAKRVLALVLALALTLSTVPGSVYAIVVGDVVAGSKAGSTGLSGNIDTADSISWPIKVYDYLNDGMLFEYSSSTGTATTNWVYGGGERMPEQNIIGYDYTINGGYSTAVSSTTGLATGTNTGLGSGAYGKATFTKWWGHSSSPFSATQVGKGTAGAFKYLRITLKSGKALKSMALTSFYFDNLNTVYSTKPRDDVRYVTIVYRTNISSPSIKVSMANQTSSGATATLYDSAGSASGSYIPSVSSTSLTTSADTWVYEVIDMAEVSGNSRWNSTTSVYSYILDINKMAAGGSEYLDLSHVAYFSDEASAINYGKDAAAFSNDPGEYLPDQQETIIPYVPETDEETTPVSAPSKVTRYLVDFTNQGTEEAALITNWSGTSWGWTITQKTSNNKSYISLSNGSSVRAIPVFQNEVYGETTGIDKGYTKYVTLVYRTHGVSSGTNISMNGIVAEEGEISRAYFNRPTFNTVNVGNVEFPISESQWTYLVYDMSNVTDDTYNSSDYPNILQQVFVFSGITSNTQSIDIAYVDFNGSSSAAETFGQQAVAYMNDATTTTTTTTTPTYGKGYKHWNMTGNVAYAMLFASQGSGWNSITWTEDGSTYYTDRGGANSWASGYYSYPIGEHLKGDGLSDSQYKNNITRHQIPEDLDYVVSDDIFAFYFNSTAGYKTDDLDLGYQLLTTGTSGLCTIGLLESSLGTVSVGKNNYKILQYKDDTIDYIAQLLEATLTIPQTDKYGNYNYSFIQGSKSSQFAYTYDTSANTVTAGITVDGKSQSKVDLATALRTRLGITFRSDMNKAVTQPERGKAVYLTAEKRAQLIGDFKDVVPYIETFADAAYYLLHNIFVDNSYSQVQDEYNYLVLSKGTIATTKKEAYIFDGGFSTGTGMTDTDGDLVADGDYAETSQSAVVYDKTAGTISLSSANSKDLIYFQSDARTTRFPFLPITDATGDYAGPSKSYFAEDAIEELKPNSIGYRDRNYNYVIQANGEFVYHVDDALFFDFEGDDDVYLFINGELVLDIGGAHSITKVGFNMNDYVDKARSILVDNDGLPGYYTGMSSDEFKAILDASSLDDTTKEEYLRWYKLDLADGQSYAIDFYYMERHGYGANMRIATNIVMTDPSMQTNKIAYQNGEEIPYGGVADKDTLVEYSFSITNSGNNKLYDLTFNDSTIGVKLDKTNGLVISNAAGKTSKAVFDKNGGTLDVSDLVINISGYTGANFSGPISVDVTLADNAALKQFMEDLTSPNTQTESTSSLYAGSGLWKDGTITIRGIYVDLDNVTITNDQFLNTVETTAATAVDSTTSLSGKDTHMLRTLSGGIQVYQWAGHKVGVHREYVFAQLSDTVKSQFKTMGSFYMDPCKANGTSYSWPGVSVNDYYTDSAGNQGTLMNIDFQKPGKNVIFLKLYRSGTQSTLDWEEYVIVPVTIYVTDVVDSTIVLDYGLRAELTGSGGIYADDYLTGSATSKHKLMGITTTTPSYMEYTWNTNTGTYQWGDDNRIDFTPMEGVIDSVTTTDDSGNEITTAFDGEYSTEDGKLYFTPTDFMDDAYTIYAAVSVYEQASNIPHAVGPSNYSLGTKDTYTLDISKEVQMYQKVTVLPANVVYYEDDFAGITYSGSGTFTPQGAGSGSLTQSADQTIPYGQDPAYVDTYEMSGNSLTSYEIPTTGGVFASFTFKGTGFEIISRTDAKTCGTMIVEVYETNTDGSKKSNVPVKQLPVITEFDNISTGSGGSEAIYQVPVLRVDGLGVTDENGKVTGPDSYIVEISASPEFYFNDEQPNWKDGDPDASINQQTLYIDGIRVFQPMGTDPKNSDGVSYYNAKEAGASFTEARQLLLDSQMAFINWKNPDETMQACTGNIIWSENRNGFYTSTQVDSIEDYLVCGPNNELYFHRDGARTGTQNSDGTEVRNTQMLLFYVQEDDDATTTGSLQIGARLVDLNLFQGLNTTGNLDMELRYITETGTTDTEEVFAEVNGSTEQYYSIDYSNCPYTTTEEGKKVYTVMLLARPIVEDSRSILSFTSLKHSGLTIKPISEVDTGLEDDKLMSGTSWSFDEHGMLVTPEGQTYGSAHFDLRQVSKTIQDIETARQLASQKPAPDVQTAVPTPEVRQSMSKTMQLSLLAAGTAVVLAGVWYLSRKYLHLL